MLSEKSSSEGDIEWKSGAEHNVRLDKARRIVHKTLNGLGRLWQNDFAERDISVMKDNDVYLIPTEVCRDAEVCVAGKANYELGQPLYERSHEMTYGDLLDYEDYRRELLRYARIGRQIRANHDLGLDVLGGKAFKLISPALDPRVKAMPAQIGNLLVADEPIIATRDWSDFGIEKGGVIANKGEVRHCDPRLYDLKRKKGPADKLLRCILSRIQEVQDTVLWSLLKDLGYKKVEYNLEKTPSRRLVVQLMKHAIPKMRAYAEEVG